MSAEDIFVVRTAHIITTGKLEPLEQLDLIKLSYFKMAFSEKPMPERYYQLMIKLYGKDWEYFEFNRGDKEETE